MNEKVAAGKSVVSTIVLWFCAVGVAAPMLKVPFGTLLFLREKTVGVAAFSDPQSITSYLKSYNIKI